MSSPTERQHADNRGRTPCAGSVGWRLAFATGAVVVAYNGSMLLHEFGHVLHLWTSGGTVTRVFVSPIDVSYVFKGENPHPQWVAWGGPVWGALLPLALLAVAWTARWRVASLAVVLAVFALLFNGAYLSVGAFQPGGDTAQLLNHGAPVWSLVAAGLPMVGAGLYVAPLVAPALRVGAGRTSLTQTVLIIGLPLGGYLAAIVVSLAVTYRLGVMMPLATVPSALGMGLVAGFALHRVSGRDRTRTRTDRLASPDRTQAIIALALAVVLVTVELVWLG